MDSFSTFFWLGYRHITDYSAIDHILFLLVLIVRFQPKDWLDIVITITLFTIGHSFTLVLSVLEVFSPPKGWIEFLIPLSIAVSALNNVVFMDKKGGKLTKWIAFLFGLIHGFGFSNYYSLLTEATGSFWSALLPFNLGIEWGQIVVVLFILGVSLLIQNILHYKHRDWLIFVSGGGFALSVWLAVENFPS